MYFKGYETVIMLLLNSCENIFCCQQRTEFAFRLKYRKASFSVRRSCKEKINVGVTLDISICTALLK
jgi:hypothetical protein